MVEFKVFSKIKGIFAKFNPLNSFDFNRIGLKKVIPTTSDELLECAIMKYADFDKVILVSIYHLFNTVNANKEYLTVLTKDLKLIADLIEGVDDEVKIPSFVKMEGKSQNILLACHNHFLGAIIPSVDDVGSAIEHNCQFVSIVSCNHIGILINESNEIDWNEFFIDFDDFSEYIGFCLDNEKGDELDGIDMMDITESERELKKSRIFDQFISDNLEKFVNEFNLRFNKYKIYELYIKL